MEHSRLFPLSSLTRLKCSPLILELLELDYDSPDDSELSDDTVTKGKRPVPTDFNRTIHKSKVVDWRNDPRMKAWQHDHSVALSEQSGESFVSRDQHYVDGVEMGNWMFGNPDRAHANTYCY